MSGGYYHRPVQIGQPSAFTVPWKGVSCSSYPGSRNFTPPAWVPVVRTYATRHAATAVQWLRDSGIRIFEITMTIPDAPAPIHELAADPTLLVGAGTVPDRATTETCLAAGARLIVAPWIDASLAAPCRTANAVLILGALTPTEVRAVLAAGADVARRISAAGAAFVGMGGALVDEKRIAAGDRVAIEAAARQVMAAP